MKDTVHEARRCGHLVHVFGRTKNYEHVEVDIFVNDVDERKGRDQRRAAEQQDVVVRKEAFLVTKPDAEPADGRKHGCSEEHRNDRLLISALCKIRRCAQTDLKGDAVNAAIVVVHTIHTFEQLT